MPHPAGGGTPRGQNIGLQYLASKKFIFPCGKVSVGVHGRMGRLRFATIPNDPPPPTLMGGLSAMTCSVKVDPGWKSMCAPIIKVVFVVYPAHVCCSSGVPHQRDMCIQVSGCCICQVLMLNHQRRVKDGSSPGCREITNFSQNRDTVARGLPRTVL